MRISGWWWFWCEAETWEVCNGVARAGGSDDEVTCSILSASGHFRDKHQTRSQPKENQTRPGSVNGLTCEIGKTNIHLSRQSRGSRNLSNKPGPDATVHPSKQAGRQVSPTPLPSSATKCKSFQKPTSFVQLCLMKLEPSLTTITTTLLGLGSEVQTSAATGTPTCCWWSALQHFSRLCLQATAKTR